MDSAAYITRTYSHLAEVATKDSQVATHPGYVVVTYRMMNVSPYLEAMGPEFTSPGRRILTILSYHRCVITENKY
jgi:hypothetical protein